MPVSGELYERVSNAPAVPQGLPLVILVTGFTDAGNAVSGLIDHLRDVADPQPIAVYDNDILLDYRARRPVFVFEQDHLSEYRPARLELSIAHDALGQQFLLLSGYEPDFFWNAFTQTVIDFIDEFGVSGTTWVHSIAMPVPHTRPISTTVSGNRKEIAASMSVWRPRTQVPGTIGHLLEYRIAERGDRVVGFVLLVPHYLAETENPDTVIAAADRVMGSTGIVLSLDELRESREEYFEKVNDQVARNDELRQMVQTLESRYDSYMAGRDPEDTDRFDAGGFD